MEVLLVGLNKENMRMSIPRYLQEFGGIIEPVTVHENLRLLFDMCLKAAHCYSCGLLPTMRLRRKWGESEKVKQSLLTFALSDHVAEQFG